MSHVSRGPCDVTCMYFACELFTAKGCVCLSECVFACIFKAAHVIVLVCV